GMGPSKRLEFEARRTRESFMRQLLPRKHIPQCADKRRAEPVADQVHDEDEDGRRRRAHKRLGHRLRHCKHGGEIEIVQNGGTEENGEGDEEVVLREGKKINWRCSAHSKRGKPAENAGASWRPPIAQKAAEKCAAPCRQRRDEAESVRAIGLAQPVI